MPGNEYYFSIYHFCEDQVIVAPMGGVVGIMHSAVRDRIRGLGFTDIEDALGKIVEISRIVLNWQRKAEKKKGK